MSDELRKMAGKAIDHAMRANHRVKSADLANTKTSDLALTSIALSLAYIVAEQIQNDDEAAAEKIRRSGLCYDHMEDLEWSGPCRVDGCDRKART